MKTPIGAPSHHALHSNVRLAIISSQAAHQWLSPLGRSSSHRPRGTVWRFGSLSPGLGKTGRGAGYLNRIILVGCVHHFLIPTEILHPDHGGCTIRR